MYFRHIEQFNYISEVFNQLDVLPPISLLTSNIIYESHESLEQIWINKFRFIFCCSVYWWELWSCIFIKIIELVSGIFLCQLFFQASFFIECWGEIGIRVILPSLGVWGYFFAITFLFAAFVTILWIYIRCSPLESFQCVLITIFKDHEIQIIVHRLINLSGTIKDKVHKHLP